MELHGFISRRDLAIGGNHLAEYHVGVERIDCYIVISGGRSSRFGSDKASINLDGRTLLARHLEAIGSQIPVVVVGESHGHQATNLTVTREQPAFGGPVAALAAGVAKAPPMSKVVAVLAVDMPFGISVIEALSAEQLQGRDAIIPTDNEGYPQPLSAIYQVSSLKRVLTEMQPVEGKSMRELMKGLNASLIRLSEELQYKLVDIDTPMDLERVRDGGMD